MTTPEHYNQFPPEFEPYKICNNANFNGNLQQIFQYVARRKHKGNEIEDLKKALDFVRFEKERETGKYPIKEDGQEYIISTEKGFIVINNELHTDFIEYALKEDPFLALVYKDLTTQIDWVCQMDCVRVLLEFKIKCLQDNIK